MNAEDDLNLLLKKMRTLQGFQNIAKNANVEIPIHKFPDRIWEVVSKLSSRLNDELKLEVVRHIGKTKEELHEQTKVTGKPMIDETSSSEEIPNA